VHRAPVLRRFQIGRAPSTEPSFGTRATLRLVSNPAITWSPGLLAGLRVVIRVERHCAEIHCAEFHCFQALRASLQAEQKARKAESRKVSKHRPMPPRLSSRGVPRAASTASRGPADLRGAPGVSSTAWLTASRHTACMDSRRRLAAAHRPLQRLVRASRHCRRRRPPYGRRWSPRAGRRAGPAPAAAPRARARAAPARPPRRPAARCGSRVCAPWACCPRPRTRPARAPRVSASAGSKDRAVKGAAARPPARPPALSP